MTAPSPVPSSAPSSVPSSVPSASDVQATFCCTLVDEWLRAGLRNVVVSPGSRSTPLALALAGRAEFELHVVLDERSAAFVAVGIARATKRAAILLCTSGTAAVEYHAAVAEADLDHVPLIVCTADRPPELHSIGAPQTVVQQNLFGGSTRWACDPGVASLANRSAWRSTAARCVLAAEHSVQGPGPVHLNLAFREPLVGTPGELPVGRNHGAPWHSGTSGRSGLTPNSAAEIAVRIAGRRGVLVVGEGCGSVSAVQALASALGWPVVADVRSGARIPGKHTISFADVFLRHRPTGEILAPEVVVRLGAPWASKVLGQWLANVPDDILVDPFDAWFDQNRASALHVSSDPTQFCLDLIDHGKLSKAPSEWLALWRHADRESDLAISSAVDEAEAKTERALTIQEPVLARSILAALPEGSHLVVSSSMPVRDIEWFGAPRNGVVVHSNRGANGIDGVVSTVVGVAIGANGAPVIGLLGDLAFFHDASGLITAASLAAPLTLVVVDNGGGGIFEFLPQAAALDRRSFELLFGTPQNVDVAALAVACGFEVIRASCVDDVVVALNKANDWVRGVQVIVVKTDRVANVDVHNRINAAAAKRLDSLK
jgi:2-succinyl-5-enolpyruvyl-6-hydroxy-3-cyclohexene-1-carboxylate synthase